MICLGGGWGKVCDVSTSVTATAVATVACRQLGFSIEGGIIIHMHMIYDMHSQPSPQSIVEILNYLLVMQPDSRMWLGLEG